MCVFPLLDLEYQRARPITYYRSNSLQSMSAKVFSFYCNFIAVCLAVVVTRLLSLLMSHRIFITRYKLELICKKPGSTAHCSAVGEWLTQLTKMLFKTSLMSFVKVCKCQRTRCSLRDSVVRHNSHGTFLLLSTDVSFTVDHYARLDHCSKAYSFHIDTFESCFIIARVFSRRAMMREDVCLYCLAIRSDGSSTRYICVSKHRLGKQIKIAACRFGSTLNGFVFADHCACFLCA